MGAVRFFFSNFRLYLWHIALLGALGFISSFIGGIGIGAVVPLLSFFVNQGSAGGGITDYVIAVFDFFSLPFTLKFLLIAIVCLFIIRAFVLLLFGYLSAWIRGDYKERTTGEMLKRLLHVRWSFFLTHKSGYVEDVVLRDVDSGAKLLDSFAQVLLSVLNIAVLFVFAFASSPRLTMISIVVGVVLMYVLRPFIRMSHDVGYKASVLGKEITQFISEHMAGMKTIRNMGVENAVLGRGYKYFITRKFFDIRRVFYAFVITASTEPISIIFISLSFYFVYGTPGFNFQVFAVTLLFIHRIFSATGSLQNAIQAVYEKLPHAMHIATLRRELDESMEQEGGDRIFQFLNTIEFRDVSFFYREDRPLFSQLNFSIKKGEVIGLIGPSGAGKTSIADLMMRLFEPRKGSIVVDGINHTSFSLNEWRKNCGYVSQDPFLMHDTIFENIKFHDETISFDMVVDAVKKASLYDFIIGLPNGFDTIVGDRGILLSGGQRQRIALARVLARSTPILILDEATSALDNESETAIQTAIHSLRGNVTVLIIAHRLSTVTNVDRLFVLENGKILEEGAPQDLLRDTRSYFYKMYHIKDQ